MRSANIGTLALMISAAVSLATLLSTGAHAALTISDKATENVTCSAGVCTATAKKGVLNVADLANLIASSPVTIQSGSEAQDIVFDASFSWTSSNGLTLDAYRSIDVNNSLSDAGAGAVVLTFGKGNKTGDLLFDNKGHLIFWGTENRLTINGKKYVLVKDIRQLAAKVAHNPSGAYALSHHDDASKYGSYADSPVPTSFTGTFEGLGNTISGLTISGASEPENLGFFAQLLPGAVVRDVRLLHVGINMEAGSQAVGALVADNQGSVKNSAADGSLSIAYYEDGSECVGSLVGDNETAADVVKSNSAVSLKQASDNASESVGGLVGCNDGTVLSSMAKGNVNGSNFGGATIGGLVGVNTTNGFVAFSSATGNVKDTYGDGEEGGLIGKNSGKVDHSAASGDITSCTYCGGLTAENYGTITNSKALGKVISGTYANSGGGLVAANYGTIDQSYALGDVTGGDQESVGGLAGGNVGTVSNSFSMGSAKATGESRSGGLLGDNTSVVTQTYSTGAVQGGFGETGGLIGENSTPAGLLSLNYWDIDTSGTDQGTGGGNVSGITGQTDAQLKSGLPTGFDPKIWAQNPKINNGYPYLIANPPSK